MVLGRIVSLKVQLPTLQEKLKCFRTRVMTMTKVLLFVNPINIRIIYI